MNSRFKIGRNAGLLALAGALALVLALVVLALRAAADDPPAAPANSAATANSATTATPPPAVTEPPSPNVTIVITVVPARAATVYWGKRVLGSIAPRGALAVQRPRDSGPLDLLIRSGGYLSVQTRAYTFSDSKLAVKLTPIDQKSTLLGYKQEVLPDAGMPLMPVAPVTSDIPQ